MELIRFRLHQLPLEKPEDGLKGEKDWNVNRKEKGKELGRPNLEIGR